MNKNNMIRPKQFILVEDSVDPMLHGGMYPPGGMTEQTDVPGAQGGRGSVNGPGASGVTTYGPQNPPPGVTGPTDFPGGGDSDVTLPTDVSGGNGGGVTGPTYVPGGNGPGVTGPTQTPWDNRGRGEMPIPPREVDDDQRLPGSELPPEETELDSTCCVGWLLVAKGPERGVSKELKPGWNNVGRSPKADVRLMGDSKISGMQIRVNYDEWNNKYSIVPHGDSSQNTRVNGATLLGPQELKHGDIIDMSRDTQLRFIPACDPKFVWCPAGEKESWRVWEEGSK